MNDHEKLMIAADAIASMSPDPSTQVGAIIAQGREILAQGYNRIARGIAYKEDQLLDRAWKYPRIIHAEKAAILNAYRAGYKLDKTYRIYVTHMPCECCALDIIESGIGEVHTRKPSPEMLERWPGMKVSRDLLVEGGVMLHYRHNL